MAAIATVYDLYTQSIVATVYDLHTQSVVATVYDLYTQSNKCGDRYDHPWFLA
jgi:hypothetical protein